MKRIFLFFLSTLYLNFALSQNNDDKRQEIEIDFQELNKEIDKARVTDPVRNGQFLIFKLSNINTFLYKVTIDGSNFELKTPIPTELQRLFRLSPTELDNTLEGDEADKLMKEAMLAKNSVLKVPDKEINLLKTDLEETLQELTPIKINFLGITEESNDGNVDEEELKRLKNEIAEKELIINQYERKIEQLNNFKTKVNQLVQSAEEIFESLQKLKVLRKELILLAQKDVGLEKMKEYINDLPVPERPERSSKDMNQRFSSIKQEFATISDAIENEKLKKFYVDELNRLDALVVSTNDQMLLDVYGEVFFLYSELKNDKNFEVTAPPVQADGDFINFVVNIVPERTHALGAFKMSKEFNFNAPIEGGLKVDFSVGPAFSFGRNSRDENFFLEDAETEGNSILRKRDNNNVINPGIGAFMHFYKRNSKSTAVGGLFGVGAGFQDLADVNLSFYTGISLIMGKRERLMLNAGLSFLNVERLKTGEFEVDEEYLIEEIDISDVTEKVFKTSVFLSLTYNLTNRVEVN